MKKTRFVSLLAVMALVFGMIVPVATAQDEVNISLSRFFGACEDQLPDDPTDVEAAVGECPIIATLINSFNAQHEGEIFIDVQGTEWGSYYDQLNATFAGGNAPDIAVMHRTRLLDYQARDLIVPLGEVFADAGIEVSDFADTAEEAITIDGTPYALPFDLHTLLWHINVDLMAEAGLVDDDGNVILPSSPEELLEHAAMVEEATGADYIAMDATQFPLGVRAVFALIWQQGGDLLNEDASAAAINGEEGRIALETMNSWFANGYADATYDYATSQEAFLNGEAAILINGTWVVDFYSDQAADEDVALSNYVVSDFPTLFDTGATWSDTHMWAVTSTAAGDEAKLDAIGTFFAFLNDNNVEWARTGHVSIRESVLESEEYQNLPHRDEYVGTADIARAFPRVLGYQRLEDILQEEFQAVWITGKSVEDALADAENRMAGIIATNQ